MDEQTADSRLFITSFTRPSQTLHVNSSLSELSKQTWQILTGTISVPLRNILLFFKGASWLISHLQKQSHHNHNIAVYLLVPVSRAKMQLVVYIDRMHLVRTICLANGAVWLSTVTWLEMQKFMRMELTPFSGLIDCHMVQSVTNLISSKNNKRYCPEHRC